MIDDAAVIWVISLKLQSSEDMAQYEQIEVCLLFWSEYAISYAAVKLDGNFLKYHKQIHFFEKIVFLVVGNKCLFQ